MFRLFLNHFLTSSMACTQKTFYSRSRILASCPTLATGAGTCPTLYRSALPRQPERYRWRQRLARGARVQSATPSRPSSGPIRTSQPVMHFTTAICRYCAPLQAVGRAGGRKAMATAGATLDVERWNNREAAMRGILQARFKQYEQFRSIVLEVQRRGWRLQHLEPRVAASKASGEETRTP